MNTYDGNFVKLDLPLLADDCSRDDAMCQAKAMLSHFSGAPHDVSPVGVAAALNRLSRAADAYDYGEPVDDDAVRRDVNLVLSRQDSWAASGVLPEGK